MRRLPAKRARTARHVDAALVVIWAVIAVLLARKVAGDGGTAYDLIFLLVAVFMLVVVFRDWRRR